MLSTTELAAENADLKANLAQKDQQIENKDQRIKLLEELVHTLRHRQFGASSEQQPDLQQPLFNEAEAIECEAETEEPAPVEVAGHQRKPRRPSLPDTLPREEVVHDLEAAEKVCPHDGSTLQHIGDETSEQLEYIPATVKVIRHLRRKYACPCCEQYVVTAAKPAQPIPKSFAAPGLLAHVATCKYVDGLPLYRMVESFKRIGVELDRTTLANWMIKLGDLVQPLINRLQEQLVEQAVLHMDETPLQVLNEPGKTAQSKSTMWVLRSTAASPAVLFHYSASRSGDTPKCLLEGFKGALMVDGYEGYAAVCDEKTLTRLGCWAHARRKFVDAQRQQPKGKQGKPDQGLAFIQKLYRIERQSQNATPDERHSLRQREAVPILKKLRAWLDKSLANSPPKASLGKALSYLDNQWPRLQHYVEDGAWPIDNNAAENAIRPFVIGRKNWLFSNSQAGARASANLYSLVESAKANGLEPYAYLRQLFTQLPLAQSLEDIDALLPWHVENGVR